jgi:hypothetical protein
VFQDPLFVVWLVVTLSTFSGASTGQLWSGVLDPTRAIDWTQSGAGTIPARPSPGSNCATLKPDATAAQINAAIAKCRNGQVVFLNAGTYHLSTGLIFNNRSNVTLRGAGADQTNLVFSGQNSCGGVYAEVCIYNGYSEYSGGPGITANWTAGYAQGATQITLDNTTRLQVGSLIILDQLEDTTDTGNVFVGQQTWSCINCNNPGRPNRAQTQTVKVTAIKGKTMTITPGLYMPNWRSSEAPGAWWAPVLPVTGDGIENLSIDSSAIANGGGIISFYNATGCWVKGVRTLMAKDSHVKFWYGSAFNTVRDSYFYGSQGHGSTSSQSYGVDGYTGSANLVENNIFQHIATPMQMEDHQGSVLGYNYAFDDFNAPAIGWLLGTASTHGPGNNYLLWEGNQHVEAVLDDFHGPADFITFFRNRTSGWQSAVTNQSATLINQAWSRYTNAIGNVLGTSGYHTNYTSMQGDGSNGRVCNHSIYALGWGGNCDTWPPYPSCDMRGCPQSDALVATTLMRWGNYDTVNNAVRWVSSEVPIGLSLYGNPVPSTHTLPPSFYLSSKPAWFGNAPFPLNGPDVTGGNIPNVGGYSNNNPAANCFSNSPVDTRYATSSSVSNASWSGGIATATIGSTATDVNPAATITVVGMNPAGYNCQHCTVISTTSASVSYSLANNPGSSGFGGTAYWPDVASFNADACYAGNGVGQRAPLTALTAVAQ